jgi:uncharacterized protein YndB with AHSA1/START domain
MKSNITGKASIKINAPISRVWEALTKPEIIKQYFFGTDTTTDWKPGSPIKFTGEWEGKSYEDKGTILDVEPNKLLRYNYWSSMSGIEDKPENYVNITYSLQEEGGQISLSITQENIPDEKTKVHSEENWNMVLGSLKKLLENEATNETVELNTL